jgi:hypothetical protein
MSADGYLKMDRDEFLAIPQRELHVGDHVLVWGSFGPIPGVIDSVDLGEEVPRFCVTHTDRLPSNKTANLIRHAD